MENSKVIPYVEYHVQSSKMGDIDPANDCLTYIANRFELNIEQRYWLAFLYATCYCGPTAFYMYNEFPDYENVNIGRLERWWKSNKKRCLFQTDRLRIKTSDQFVPTFESYKAWIGNGTQQQKFYSFKSPRGTYNYEQAYGSALSIRNFGRFTMFIYLEMVNLLTDFQCVPNRIDWKHADNCRAGLQAAWDEMPGKGNSEYYAHLDSLLQHTKSLVGIRAAKHANIFSIETTLCAYAKYMKGQRYIGYYIDRQRKEIEKMEEAVPTGVCWRVLWEFRKETYGKA